jgi:ribosomal protein S18 acetylase RimI-like enzyme/ubiquinone/menaquinone biosynthesis C-methylase UbiE
VTSIEENRNLSELDAVRRRYLKRSTERLDSRYRLSNPAVHSAVQERERAFLRWLGYSHVDPANAKVLEIGCGSGLNLLDLIRFGFDPRNLTANDLMEGRLGETRRRLPSQVTCIAGDAAAIDLPPESFDIVMQYTVFTSLLDEAFQHSLASRMWNLLKPGGGVLWYDFCFDNPSNPDVKGVPLARIRELFPHAKIRFARVTLAPPLARFCVRLHPAFYTALNTLFPFLRTHILCWIEKPAPTSAASPTVELTRRRRFDRDAVIRRLHASDAHEMARIHVAAFPSTTLTAAGAKHVAKFYAWHLTQPHCAGAVGIEQDGMLVGFAVLVHRNNITGYLAAHAVSAAFAILSRPRAILPWITRKRGLRFMQTTLNPPPSWVGQQGTVRVLAIAVDSSMQSLGAGSRLLAEVERAAAGIGAARIALSVHAGNAGAIRFYERHGWTKVLLDGAWTGEMQKDISRLTFPS